MDGMRMELNFLQSVIEGTKEPSKLPFHLLQLITDNFSEEQRIGSGGFSGIFKSTLRGVAVKRLIQTEHTEEMFHREVEISMMCRHQNILRFLGYCSYTEAQLCNYKGKTVMADIRERLLCSEYLSNGTLKDYISDPSCQREWRNRYKLIKGICEGLQYLHGKRIAHLDLKPENILVGDNMVPKIYDFGLSRCLDEERSKEITVDIIGTYGYMAPEHINKGRISLKNDIYSLGVVISNILSGEHSIDDPIGILESWRSILETSSAELLLEQVRFCAEISIACMEEDPAKRPDIARITEMLDETETRAACTALATHFSKIQCLRICPDVANFTRIEQVTSHNYSSNNGIDEEVAGPSAATTAAWETHETDHMVYTQLTHTLLSPHTRKNCIAGCVGASSTDHFPEETIKNTLDPLESSHWSSEGHADPAVPQYLMYRLCSDMCLINEIRVQPFRAFLQKGHPIFGHRFFSDGSDFFEEGDPIFSAQYVRIKLGYPKVPLQPEDLVTDENEGKLSADNNYIWTYTSPEFPMSQENELQSFKLPCSVLCIGGVVKVELLGRVQKQRDDDLYYIGVTHVQILGTPLASEFGAAASGNELVLMYCLGPGQSSCSELSGSRSKWRNFEGRLWRDVTGPGIGLNQELLSSLLGPWFQFLVDDDDEMNDACPP